MQICALTHVLPAFEDIILAKEFASNTELTQVMMIQSRLIEPELVTAWTASRVIGQVPNPELIGSAGIFETSTTISETKNVTYMPAFGAVLNEQGLVYAETIAEAKFAYPDLSFLDHLQPPALEYEEACIFLPWGGLTNFGHFLIDGLCGIEALRHAGHNAPLLSPPLKPWQRELLALINETAIETDASVVKLNSVVWTSCMDHFLQSPNSGLARLREKLVANIAVQERIKGIYVSRSRNVHEKRRMLNEIALERALQKQGYLIVYPEDLSIVEQASLFARADCIISATGAQITNAIFCRPNTKIVELCPIQYTGVWIRNLCYGLNLHWCCYYFDGLERIINDYSFEYRIDVEKTAEFLETLR